ncbi:MAG: hypothetical protein IPM06_21050 [Rhizobiales bacterium]|nr:hypothetical protein [Hyphomicrobiales bacterium]
MTSIAISDLGPEYDRLFGARDEPRGAGRSRKCRHCGDWHQLDTWPHNCRDERPPRANLAAPMVAPAFGDFMTGVTETAEYIGDRRARREFMERHDLVEYDEGVKTEPEPTERQWVEDFVRDFKRVQQEDPLNRPPIDRIGETDLDGSAEIDASDIEVFK